MSNAPPVMQCPHANGVLRGHVRICPTCENSAVAYELRDLRRVARAALMLVEVSRSEADAVCDTGCFAALETTLEMAKETSPTLRVGTAQGGG